MSQSIVFDIETYHSSWRVSQSRREDFDPAINSIITVGFFDGKEISIYHVIEDLKEESQLIEFFLRKIGEFEGSTLVGYNILHFDIPYLLYKARSIGKDMDLNRFKLLDLFWILPYWLHNVTTGLSFLKKNPYLGNLWSLSKVVKYILNEKPNPISNLDLFPLWETKQFKNIEKHLELDLRHTFSFFESSVIQETLNHIKTQHFNKRNCEDLCPFHHFLQKTSDRVIGYCTLLQEVTLDEKKLSTIDIIDYPLPRRGIRWTPYWAE